MAEMEKFEQLQEAERNNEPFMITYYSFKGRRVFTEEFQTQDEALQLFTKIFDSPKILSRGDAVLRKRNYGADQNISLLMKTFRDEREQIKKSRQLSLEQSMLENQAMLQSETAEANPSSSQNSKP